MTTLRVCLVMVGALLGAPVLQGAAPLAIPLPSEVTRWIEQLGDDSFSVREGATKKLQAAGEVVEEALVRASKSTDEEISRRAKVILEQYRWGIFPDTPEAVVKLIRSYQSAARTEKRDLIRKLLVSGGHGCRALAKIARYEKDAQVKKEVFADLAASLGKVAPQLIEEGNRAALEGLLEMAVNGDTKSGALNYSAYYLLSGQLPERVREWETRAKRAVVAKAENEVLAYLYRAMGDRVRARKAAEEAERNDLVEATLYEAADWKALAAKPQLIEGEDVLRRLGYEAAYSRLSGNKRNADDILANVQKLAEPLVKNKGFVLPYAKALFINGLGTEATDMLRKSELPRRWVVEVLIAQNRFKDAFELVEEVRKNRQTNELPILEIMEARALHQLGEKDKALTALKKYSEQVKGNPEQDWITELVEAELAIGRRDQAFAVAAKTLSESADNRWPGRLFEKLFGRRRADDGVRCRMLLRRVYKEDTQGKTLDRLRAFFEGKATAKELEALFKDAPDEMMGPAKGDIAEEWRILGDIAILHKQEEKASKAYGEAGTARAGLREGDRLFAQKKWREAATVYLAAYQKARKAGAPEEGTASDEGESLPALALFMSGQALVEAGQGRAGKERIEKAHLLPLADAEMRYELAQALLRRGQKEGARREFELLRLVGEPVLLDPASYFTGEGMRAAALDAVARKEWFKAADGFEQSFLRILHPNMSFQRTAAYVVVPAFIFHLRARGFLEGGKFEEANTEIERAKNCVPGHVELAMHIVPIMDRKNRKKEADNLFRATVAPYRELLKSYPKSPWALNQYAWLTATCHRELEQGLKYAKEAVKQAPDTAAYHDTLAEVLFQLGKKEEAVVAQKKAVALAPDRVYFKKQLKRIEAGDPKVERPIEGDE